jgi:hypothetical protein
MVTDKSPRTQEIAKIDESEQVETSERSVVTYLVIASESQQCKDIIIDTATSCVKYKLNKKLKNKYKRKQE